MRLEIVYSKADGLTPNNVFPSNIYRGVLKQIDVKINGSFKRIFESNNWTNNWADIILTENHYHSTTHEVIGLDQGEVSLKIGGKGGKIISLQEGDDILIPAGTGHYSLNNNKYYKAIGGYPNGAEWDMIFDEKDKYDSAINRIRKIPIPEQDPVFGTEGILFKYWK